jgi:hypothetical protein
MDERTAKKLKGAANMVVGAARVVSGVATATGHGIVGAALRKHHMTAQALRLGQMSAKAGAEQFQRGLSQLEG